MTHFVPGLELAEALYREAVRPVLDDLFPGLVHSAALIGPGSEVLGYDTVRSTDHDWGPRMLLFTSPADARRHGRHLVETLEHRLPGSVAGWSTNFSPPTLSRSRVLEPAGDGLIRHRVDVHDLSSWLIDQLGIDPRKHLHAVDWLSVPGQRLLEVTAGAVFHDGLGQLEPLRRALAWYPVDVWRYLLAAQWHRIAEDEPFPGRCAELGDDLGSRLVTARLVRDLMRLALLVERRYPPYAKWLGTAFSSLPCAADLQPLLAGVLAAPDWSRREDALCGAYELLARSQNALGLAAPVEPTVRSYFGRPFRVLSADRFAEALRGAVTDPEVLALPPHLGGVDQFVDSTDVLTDPARARSAAVPLLTTDGPP
jgi:hypothetical protein